LLIVVKGRQGWALLPLENSALFLVGNLKNGTERDKEGNVKCVCIDEFS